MSAPALEFVDDVSPAAWLRDAIKGFGVNVGSIVPHGFEAYARVFHPAAFGRRPVSWTKVARANGTTMHRAAQLGALAGVAELWSEHPGVWDRPPTIGHLPGFAPPGHDVVDLATPLVEVLAGHTGTPDRIWFCIWEGWGGLRAPAHGSKVELPHRSYRLARGSLATAVRAFAPVGAPGPSIWWPDDRAWCVATEIDFSWTYVAGSRALVDGLVADDRFEALEALVTDGVTHDSDHLNR